MDNSSNPMIPNHNESDPNTNPVVAKRRLGRGLSALLGGSEDEQQNPAESNAAPAVADPNEPTVSELCRLKIDQIQRNPNQPRKEFDEESMAELAESIRKHGVLQPVLVREYGEKYELIAGERRWVAAQKAGLNDVPCRIVDVIDQTACEFAFEENLKREDLKDLEKAQAFRNYIDLFETTVDELAKQLSMSRSAVSNTMRLLDLPEKVKKAMQAGHLTAGHARAILSLKEEEQRLELSKLIQKEQLSVRKAEAAAKEMQGKTEPETVKIEDADKPAKPELSNHLKSIQDQLRDAIGVKVDLKLKTKDSGQVVLHFTNNDDFDRIVNTLRETQSRAA